MFGKIRSDSKLTFNKYMQEENQKSKFKEQCQQLPDRLASSQHVRNYEYNDPNKYRVSQVSPKLENKSIYSSKAESSNLVELYKKENANLKEQNQYLIEKLRQYKKNQFHLLTYIKQMQQERCDRTSLVDTEQTQDMVQVKLIGRNLESNKKLLLKSKSGALFNKQNKRSNLSHLQESSSVQNLFELNNQFCKQMKLSSVQANPEKRKIIRQSMAKIAYDMKSIRQHIKK